MILPYSLDPSLKCAMAFRNSQEHVPPKEERDVPLYNRRGLGGTTTTPFKSHSQNVNYILCVTGTHAKQHELMYH